MRNPSFGSVRVVFPRFSREELIELLRRDVRSLAGELPLRRVVLFGSWASGRATAYSDIDVLVVYADPPRDDAYKTVRRHLRLRGLEPHLYSEGEARQVDLILERMTAGGVDLLV